MKNLLFVSKDLGSGQALAPVIKKLKSDVEKNIIVISSGLSSKLFRDMDIDFIDADIEEFKNFSDLNSDLIITGASMRESIEKQAISYAKKEEVPCITILDYWGNYWDRFTVDGNIDQGTLPDFIFVPDRTAKEDMIGEGFPPDKLVITGNPYFDTFEENKNREREMNPKTILFISQPEYVDREYRTDLKKVEDIKDIIFRKDPMARLIIKLHPKESREYYNKIKMSEKVKVCWEEELSSLLKESDIIIGTDSTAMFESVFIGKSVISYQPELKGKDLLITNKLGLSMLARTKSELDHIVDKALDGELIKKEINVFKYLNDGLCSERVTDFINKITM